MHAPAGPARAHRPVRPLAVAAFGIAVLATAPPAAAGAQTGDPARPPLVIRDVNVIPMDREEVLEGRTVVIRDGRIEAVEAGSVDAPPGAVVVNGTGMYLMPGLAEMHAHVGSPEANARILPLYVLNGVTTARGMLGQPAHLALRDSLARGAVLGPRLLTSGPSFGGGDIGPEEARRRVREQAEAGYDLLKIHPGPSRATFDALAETAREVGMPFAGHVPADVGLERAIEAGIHTVDHLDGFVEALVPEGAEGVPAQAGWFGLNLVPFVDTSAIPALVARVREAGVAVVPTQTLMEHYASDLTGDELADRPDYRFWPREQVEQWRIQKNDRLADPATPSAEQRAAYLDLRLRLIRELYHGGVPVLLGSDAPQVWNVPGFAAHRELQTYVDADLTPYEALRTGTVEIARHLGEEGRSGVVRPGARADLVLLEANPLADIANTMTIAGIVANGRWIDRAERERLLEGLRAR